MSIQLATELDSQVTQGTTRASRAGTKRSIALPASSNLDFPPEATRQISVETLMGNDVRNSRRELSRKPNRKPLLLGHPSLTEFTLSHSDLLARRTKLPLAQTLWLWQIVNPRSISSANDSHNAVGIHSFAKFGAIDTFQNP